MTHPDGFTEPQVTIERVGTGTVRIAGHSRGAGMEQSSLAEGYCMAAGDAFMK